MESLTVTVFTLAALERLALAAARLLLRVVPRLPERPLLRLCDLLGRLSYLLAPATRRTALRTLDAVAPGLPAAEARRLVTRHFGHLYKNLAELLRTPRLTSAKALDGKVTFEGLERLDAALARGRGVILLVPHFGNWELLGAALALKGFPLNSFYLDLRFRDLSDLLNATRRRTGIRLIGRHELRKSVDALKRNEILGILADQDGGPGGFLAWFFGRPVSFPSGPSRLQRMTGAAVVPCVLFRRDDDTCLLKTYPELPMTKSPAKGADERENAARMLIFYERLVRERPEQWLLIYDRFKDRRHVRTLLAEALGRTPERAAPHD